MTLGAVTILIVACALLGAVTDLFLRSYLLGQLDSELASAGGRFSASLERDPQSLHPGGSDGDADNAPGGQSVGTIGVRLVSGRVTNAAIVADDGRNRPLTFDADDAKQLAALRVNGPARSADLDAIGDYRLEAVAGRDGDVQITGLPLHQINATLLRLITVEAVVFGALVAVGGLTTVLFVRRAIRPLTTITDTALHIAQLPLSVAVPAMPQLPVRDDPVSEPERLTVAFDAMYTHVHHALAERDAIETRLRQFIADASHELNTPLALIRAHAEYALRSGTSHDEALQAVHRVSGAAGRMTALVDQLLLLARLDGGHALHFTEVDLSALVVETVTDARIRFPEDTWQLRLPSEPLTIPGDSARLHQVVANLLSNAATHNEPGVAVTTSLEARPDAVLLAVTDEGVGIPKEQQARVFERFSRGDSSRSREHGSTGLGLAIVRGIVTGHGGSISLTSEPGRTTFRIELPVVSPSSDGRPEEPPDQVRHSEADRPPDQHARHGSRR
jgi:two-component system OmpR family sensor kinase